jgi:hypothetical protein
MAQESSLSSSQTVHLWGGADLRPLRWQFGNGSAQKICAAPSENSKESGSVPKPGNAGQAARVS